VVPSSFSLSLSILGEEVRARELAGNASQCADWAVIVVVQLPAEKRFAANGGLWVV